MKKTITMLLAALGIVGCLAGCGSTELASTPQTQANTSTGTTSTMSATTNQSFDAGKYLDAIPTFRNSPMSPYVTGVLGALANKAAESGSNLYLGSDVISEQLDGFLWFSARMGYDNANMVETEVWVSDSGEILKVAVEGDEGFSGGLALWENGTSEEKEMMYSVGFKVFSDYDTYKFMRYIEEHENFRLGDNW